MAKFHIPSQSTRSVVPSNSGTYEKQNYTIQLDKETGHKMIKAAGFTNTYEKIQAGRDASDINMILKRAQYGDVSGFKDATKAVYGDMTMIPDNMIDIANLKLKSDQAWDKLPLEVRREYDHDKDKYFADFGSDHWMKIHGIEKKPDVEITPIEKEKTE